MVAASLREPSTPPIHSESSRQRAVGEHRSGSRRSVDGLAQPVLRGARAVSLALSLLFAAGSSLAQITEFTTGSLRGVVKDKDFGSSLARVRVTILEAQRTTVTSTEGSFLFDRVPQGTYTISFSKDGYDRVVLPNVVVAAGRMNEVQVEMASEVVEMDELVVTGTDVLAGSDVGILEIRSASVAVQDSISADLMSKAGVGDVASALKLVVGASVSEGKYATVRGLSDRYTGTTLNGVRVASADPRRRAVQIDLFPTGTIESLTVTKTFTPDLQGEFTGGGVDIKTKSVPDGLLLSVSTSMEWNSEATGNENFLTYRGGGVKALGSDDSRALPDGARRAMPPVPNFSTPATPEQMKDSRAYNSLVRSFAPAMGVDATKPGPGYGFSFVAGNRFQLGGGSVLGAMAALTYSRKYDSYEDARNNSGGKSGVDAPIVLSKRRIDDRGTDDLLIGTLGSLELRPNDRHTLTLTATVNQSAEDEARFQTHKTGSSTVEQNQSLHYTERNLETLMLRGRHVLGGPEGAGKDRPGAVQIDWFAAGIKTKQDEPDVRFFRNSYNTEFLVAERPGNSTDSQNTRRIFRDIEEGNWQAGVDVTVPFTRMETEGKLKGGLLGDFTDREYEQLSFTYVFPTQSGSFSNDAVRHNRTLARFTGKDPDDLWTDVFTSTNRTGLAPNRCQPGTPPPCAAENQLLWILQPAENDVNYTGDQEIDAAYLMADFPLSAKLRLIGGARYETTDMSIVPTSTNGRVDVIQITNQDGDRGIVTVPQAQAASRIDESSLLPALGLVLKLSSSANLRASWSRTIARPTFREMAPVATEEFIAGDNYIGNPALILSDIQNADLRAEWFPRAGDVLAVSLFFKSIENPIELISFNAGGNPYIQPVNYEQGSVKGYEIEARWSLNAFSKALEGLSAGANFTSINSEVDVPEDEQASLASTGLAERTRRLQGQPEYLLNASLAYDRAGTSIGLFYNIVGETLVTGAARGDTDGLPNVFEEPVRTVDLSFGHRFANSFSLSLRGRNLLAPSRRSVYRTPDGQGETRSDRDTARIFSLSAAITW